MKLSDGTVLASAYRAQNAQIAHGVDHVKRSDRLKIGTIVAVRNVDSTEGLQKSANNSSKGVEGSPYETVYDVRVDDHNARPFIFNGCRALKPFMGANNYFEVIHESADLSPTYIEQGPAGLFAAAAESLVGSRCVILCIEGEPTAPTILGFLQHPGRTSKITEDMGLHMEFEFNGFKCSIDKDGAFKIEANGPYVDAISPPVGPVPDSSIRTNPLIGPFTVELDSGMNLSIKDNKNQEIRISRDDGEMEVTNGSESIKLVQSLTGQGEIIINVGDKLTISAQKATIGFDVSCDLSTKQLAITADTSMSVDAGDVNFSAKKGFSADALEVKLTAKTNFKVDATKVSIKGATGELLALINELITAIGAITAASPIGPCAPIQAAPQWVQVQLALQKLQGMTG